MLVLSRKLGDRLVIAESIEITVVEIRGTKVRLGVSAPRQVSVRRHEVPARPQARHPGQRSPAPGPQDTLFEIVRVNSSAAHAADHGEQKLAPG